MMQKETSYAKPQVINCNTCVHCSVTEEDQERLKKSGVRVIHVCDKYKMQVYHLTCRPASFHKTIYPLSTVLRGNWL